MEIFAEGFALFAQWPVLVAMVIGTVLGMVVGAIPGIGPAQLIPISIPVTFTMAPVPALMFLLGEFIGGIYAGSISAILVNSPGTPASIATTFDGYPLARAGKAGKALKMALYGSVIGDLISTAILIVVAERIARIALKFGPAEIAAVIVFSLTLVAAVAGRSLVLGFVSAIAGGLLASVGMDSITGTTRFAFGVVELLSGIGLLPLIMGLFAVSEILVLAEHRITGQTGEIRDLRDETAENRRLTLAEVWSVRGALTRGAATGIGVGSLPGLGASVAAILAYGWARRSSKNPEAFGTGCLEGLAAPECANNAETSGALLPFLTLGIPGSALIAMLGGAFLLHGLEPGPLLFEEHGDKIYALYCGLIAINLVMLVVGLAGMNLFHYVVKVPTDILFSIVLILCVSGVFAVSASLHEVSVMLIFGVVGYGMRKLDIPIPPLLIAFLLVPMLEHSFRQALLISGGSLMIFITHPISAGFLLATVAWLVFRAIRNRRRPDAQADE
ncbi:MAG: tripartite tricarboxylate transporter permease [Rhodospirillales bacterium]|nr:tripartite tricarboxylate transporter permease [Rhodospirillales bacterium]